MTRVLYVTADEERETFLRTEVSALREIGVDVRVVSLRQLMRDPRAYRSPSGTARLLRAVDPRRDRLPVKAWPKTVVASWLAAAVVRSVEDWQPEHVHGFWASGPASAAWVVARRLGVPFSFSAHRSDVYAGELLRLKLRDAAFVRAISQRACDVLRATGDARIEVVRVGVDVPDLVSAPRQPGRFLAVGNLLPVKGHLGALRAVELAAEAGADVALDIVGDGPLSERLEDRIDGSPVLRSRARLLGRLPHDEVLAAMATYGALVHPSVVGPGGLEEGVPVAVLEAGVRGLPVVATLSGATGELVDDGVGWPVPPGDVIALAATMAAVCGDRAEAERRAAALRERIAESWDVRHCAARLAALFGEG